MANPRQQQKQQQQKIFRSTLGDIPPLPTDPLWTHLFSSSSALVNTQPANKLAGYLNAATGEYLSWADVKELSTNLCTTLVKDYGLVSGDVISLFSGNTVWYPIALWAGLRAGAQISGASPAYTVDEMAYALKTAKAKFLFTSPASLPVASKAAEQAGLPQQNIFLLVSEADAKKETKNKTIHHLIGAGRAYGKDQSPEFKLPKGQTLAQTCGFLSFSSGTTGLPKAVRISHANVLAQCLQVISQTPDTHKKVLGAVPLFHITGLVHVLTLPLFINATVILLPVFTMEAMLSAIVKHQIEELLLVPPLCIRLVRDPIVKNYDLSHVKRFSSGAAPLSEEILQIMAARWPGTTFKQGYGMTESCSVLTAHPLSYTGYKLSHSVGKIAPSTEVRFKVVSDSESESDDRDASVGEEGEILARGPQVTMGYLNNPSATSSTFDSDGWLHTGDVGRIDADGWVYVTDRIKELIKVNGVQVAPAEVEDCLLGFNLVADVAVMGVPPVRGSEGDVRGSGEVVRAYVVLKDDVEGNDSNNDGARRDLGEQVMRYVAERKVREKWVREVLFVKEIPKSASGKILRRVLKGMTVEEDKVVRMRKEFRAKL